MIANDDGDLELLPDLLSKERTDALVHYYAFGGTEEQQKDTAKTLNALIHLAEVTRKRPYKPTLVRIERGDYQRASGDVACAVCELPYRDHAPVVGFPFLNQLCDGRMVKL